MNNAYDIVKMFERRVAAHFNLDHGIAVDCCTNGVFLALKYRQHCGESHPHAHIPKHTYVSVPYAIMDAGVLPVFEDRAWHDCYTIQPWRVMDAAKLWQGAHIQTLGRRGYLWCVSFHIKKPIPIGRGGMILTTDDRAADWLRKARYDGRFGVPFDQEPLTERGWHMYMTPEQAARGMALMDTYPQGVLIPAEVYPDLSTKPIFQA